MKTTSIGILGGALLVLSLAACEQTRTPEQPTGRVMLSITSAPMDAACLRITAKGATTAVRSLPLMTGMSTVFPLEGLPVGLVEFTGEAFPVGCAMVAATTQATYVSEVVRVTLVENETVDVALALRRPGRANVAVDFPGGGPGLPNGAACASSSACTSGFCVDGVCCNTACVGSCQSCNRVPGGICAPDPVGTTCSQATCMGTLAIPAGSCNAMGMCQPSPPVDCAPRVCVSGSCRMCAMDGDCQPGFACRNGTCASAGQPNGSPCSAASQCTSGICANGVCCSSACGGPCQTCSAMPGTCTPLPMGTTCGAGSCPTPNTANPPAICNGTGACQPQMPRSCSPFLCQNGTCRTSCLDDGECAPGFVCRGGTCASSMGLPNGSMCGAASQCASGFCVDGFCCNTACTGACQSCNRAGSAGTCAPDPAGIVCAPQSCMGSTFIPPSACNGMGMCVSQMPRSCAPFVCGMNACLTSCASNADCQAGLICQAGSCRPPMPPLTVTISAEADAYVRDGANAANNFGADPALPVKNSSAAGNSRISYLRFPLTAVATVGQARLRLYGSRATVSMLTDAAFAVSSNMWTETGITWNARPAIGGKLGASVVVTATQYYEWDVTAHVQQQKLAGASAVSLAVQMEMATGNSPDSFNAREAGSNPPQLVVTP